MKLTYLQLYRKFWRIADSILKERKPCQFEVDDQGRVTCWSNRERNVTELSQREEWHKKGINSWALSREPDLVFNGCCNGCDKLNPKTGCTVDNLECKMWTCGEMRLKGDQVTVVALETLRLTARAIGLPSKGWCSAEDAFVKGRGKEFPQYAFRHSGETPRFNR